MASLTRLRAHAAQWAVVAVLAAAAVFVAAGGSAATRIEDEALRQLVSAAPSVDRDIELTVPADSQPGVEQLSASRMNAMAVANLPASLQRVVETSWGYQRTSLSAANNDGAVLTGDGVLGEPDNWAPVVSFHHQPDLADQITIVDGMAPETDPDGDVIEVMVSAAVAEAVGLVVGGDYRLHPGFVARRPGAEASPTMPSVRVTGVFTPRDPDAPAWEHLREVLAAPHVTLPYDDPPYPLTTRAGLVTDQGAFQLLNLRHLGSILRPDTTVRVRLDAARLDAAWVPQAEVALAALETDRPVPDATVHTGLRDLLDTYRRRAAAARAVIAVTAAGILATVLGLLALAARLAVERRRDELSLLRARGGSLPAMAGRLLAEAAWPVLPAAAAGWVLHRLAVGEPLWPAGPAAAAIPAAAVAAALLVVPVAGVWAVRRTSAAPAARRGRRRRQVPARPVAEAGVVLLAGLGVLLLHRRGLALHGVDPYLSAVPVLLAAGAGVLALRVYPWPVRAAAAVAGRARGVVGFLGLARSGRAAPGAAWALLVLVLAVAVGGFAGAVHSSVAQARDAAAVQAVGADIRVTGELTPAAVAAVERVPGVTAVAAAGRTALLVDPERQQVVAGPAVVAVDAAEYQRVLAALGVDRRLPDRLVGARPGGGAVPAVVSASVTRRDGWAVRVGERDYPVSVVGQLPDLPGSGWGPGWLLVPRQALAEPGPVGELFVAGAGADPRAVRDALAELELGDVTVTSLAERRAEVEGSAFNSGLTLVFVAGALAGAAGALAAVTLALVLQARSRGRVLSLLRTLGMSPRQARGVLLVELLPMAAFAVAVGAVVGVGLPPLLGPALGLEQFTGGAPLRIGADLATVAMLAGAVAVLVVGGVAVEAAANRRLDLGRVLRVE